MALPGFPLRLRRIAAWSSPVAFTQGWHWGNWSDLPNGVPPLSTPQVWDAYETVLKIIVELTKHLKFFDHIGKHRKKSEVEDSHQASSVLAVHQVSWANPQSYWSWKQHVPCATACLRWGMRLWPLRQTLVTLLALFADEILPNCFLWHLKVLCLCACALKPVSHVNGSIWPNDFPGWRHFALTVFLHKRTLC